MGLFTFWQKDKPPSHSFVPSTPRPTPHIHTGPNLTITQRIQNGAAILDEALPGWEKRVDRSTLDIQTNGHCVLGQLFGKFLNGVKVLHLPLASTQELYPANLGFDKDTASYTWHELNDEWQKFLAEREHEQAYQAKNT